MLNFLPVHQRGIFAVILAGVIWSTGGIFIKLISLNAFQLSFFRSLLAAAVFAFLFRIEVTKINGLSILSSVFYAGILILFVAATKMTSAANAIFLQYTAPFYVLVLEPLLLKTKFDRMNLVILIICFSGMFLFFMGDFGEGYLYGNLVAVASGVCFAAFLLLVRKNGNEYQSASIFWGNIIIALICSFSLPEIVALNSDDLIMVSYLGVFQIGIAYAIFSYGLKRVTAIEASLLSMIEPVLNPVWVYFGYGESPSSYSIIGGIIIILALSLNIYLYGRRAKAVKDLID
ncbi:MAG: EamA family transporter [Ignavibacteriaceae bacterium]|nr:EamA family transporter [Ignavibacteriaceae bacterium]